MTSEKNICCNGVAMWGENNFANKKTIINLKLYFKEKQASWKRKQCYALLFDDKGTELSHYPKQTNKE